MNLLDSVLYASKAEKFSSNFKQHEIDATSLKLLTDEDLELLGIEDEEIRNSVLKHAANLQIPSEKLIDIVIDEKYIIAVLAQISVHLTKHLAALSIALNRDDIVICNLKLSPAVKCLDNCVKSLDKELNVFADKVTTLQRKEKSVKKVLILTLLAATVGLVSIKLLNIFLRTR